MENHFLFYWYSAILWYKVPKSNIKRWSTKALMRISLGYKLSSLPKAAAMYAKIARLDNVHNIVCKVFLVIYCVCCVEAKPVETTIEFAENVNTETTERNVTPSPNRSPALSEEAEEATPAVEVSKDRFLEKSTQLDTPVYAGYLVPQTFQEYLNQLGVHLVPHPYYGYAGALAPFYASPNASPDHEDFSASTNAVKPAGTLDGTPSTLTNFFTNFMDSRLFRVILTIAVVIMSTFLTGAAVAAICHLTPICSGTSNAISYVSGKGVGDVGHMLMEEMTPERLSRATNFVRNAMDKYQTLSKQIATED
uniref:Uncharacterized protein n=1 Tax=Glossina palpalis gambiensis TaxID=67801 RepID=A0A1B0B2P2_9MUSC